MINLGGIDFELNTLAPNPEFNYEEVYIERQMISGKIRRIYKGRRLNMSITYGYLTDQQISNLYGLLSSQLTNGYIAAAITTPNGSFNGNVMLDIDESQKRFKINSNGKGVWSNWVITLTGVDLV